MNNEIEYRKCIEYKTIRANNEDEEEAQREERNSNWGGKKMKMIDSLYINARTMYVLRKYSRGWDVLHVD